MSIGFNWCYFPTNVSPLYPWLPVVLMEAVNILQKKMKRMVFMHVQLSRFFEFVY